MYLRRSNTHTHTRTHTPLYTVLLRKLPAELRGMPVFGYTVTVGTVLILPFYLYETMNGRPVPLTPVSIASILYVAIFPSVLAYLFWNTKTPMCATARFSGTPSLSCRGEKNECH